MCLLCKTKLKTNIKTHPARNSNRTKKKKKKTRHMKQKIVGTLVRRHGTQQD